MPRKLSGIAAFLFVLISLAGTVSAADYIIQDSNNNQLFVINESGEKQLFNGQLLANGNSIGTGGSNLVINDTANNQDIVSFRESTSSQNIIKYPDPTVQQFEADSFNWIWDTVGNDLEIRIGGTGGAEFAWKADGNDVNTAQIGIASGDVRIGGSASSTPGLTINEGSIDMQDNQINDVSQLTLGWQNLTDYPNGCSSGDAVRVIGDSLTCIDISGETADLYVNETGDTMTGNLDMDGNNVTSIDTLKFEEGTSINGDLDIDGSIDTTGDLNMSDQDINDVRSINGGGDSVRYDNDLDMNENEIVNIDGLQDGDGTNTVRFDGSNNVEVPNGELNVSGGDLEVYDGNLSISSDKKFYLDDKNNHFIRYNSDNNRVEINAGNRFDFLTAGNNALRTNGAPIMMKGGSIQQIGGQSDASSGAIRLSNAVSIQARNSGNSGDIEVIGTDSSDNVQIGSNGNANSLEVSSGPVRLKGTSGTGDRFLNFSTSDTSYAFSFQQVSGGTNDDIALVGPGGNEFFRASDSVGGEITMMNGIESRADIDLRGNNLVDGSASDLVTVGDGSDDSVTVDAGGSGSFTVNTGDTSSGSTERFTISSASGDAVADVKNADLDLNSNNIKNVHSLTNGGSDINVNDTVEMNGNSIQNVNALDLDSTGDIRSDGTDAIRLDSNQNVAIPNGNLDATGQTVFAKRFEGTGGSSNDLDIASGNVDGRVQIRASNTDLIDANYNGNNNVEIPNGNLNVSGNEITNLGDSFDPSDAVDKEYVDTSDDTVADDQNLKEVLVHGNTANQSIDMQDNQIKDVSKLTLGWKNLTDYPSGCANDEAVQVVGDTLDCTSLNPGGTVETTGASEGQVAYFIDSENVSGSSNFYWNNSEVQLGIGTNNPSAALDVNGNVNLRDNLQMNGNWVSNDGGNEGMYVDTAGNIGIGTNSPSNLLTVDGDAQVRGNLDVWGTVTNTDVQNLNVNGSLIPPSGYSGEFDVGNSTNQWRNADFSGNVKVGGNVDGVDLDNPGNAISVSSNQYQVDSNSISSSEITNSGSFTFNGITSNSDIDANSNNLDDVSNIYQDDSNTNFFGSDCSSGQVVAGVNSDGTYNCVDADNQITDNYVNESGDTMTGDLLIQDGSASDPELAFANDADTGLFRSGADRISLTRGGSEKLRLSANVNLVNGADLNTAGGNIINVGGTTDASSGAIRLANDREISWRNSGDTNDVSIKVDSQNDIVLGNDGSADVRIGNGNLNAGGGILYGIGSTTDASSGAIRLANAKSIQARNSGNSGDIEVIGTDSSDNVNIGGNNNVNNVNVRNANLDVNGPSNTGKTVDVGGGINTDGNINTNGNDVNGVKKISFNSAGSVSGSSGDICMGDRCS